jgi:hypothetical protein
MPRIAFRSLLMLVVASCSLGAQIPEWTVAPDPVISAGDGEGEGHSLLFVRDALLLPSDQLAVLSAGTRDIRLFDEPNRFVRTIGREGEGPGEFKSPSGFRFVASTGHVLVYDGGTLRLTEFDSSWAVYRTARVAYDMTASTPAFGRPRPMLSGLVPAATYDVPMREMIGRAEGVYHDDLVIDLMNGEEVVSSVRRERGPVYQVREGSTGLTIPLSMTDGVLFSWGPSRVVLGSTHSTEIVISDSRGVEVGTVHGVGTSYMPTDADFELWEARVRDTHGGSTTIGRVRTNSDGRVERFLKDAPRGDRLPIFDALTVADDGSVWIREYRRNTDSATWQVIDPSVGVVARVTLPGHWKLLRSAQSYVIVLELDEYDVEFVRLYRLVH